MPMFRSSRPIVLLAAAAVALAGCSDSTRPEPGPLPELTASAVSGSDGQSTVAGVALPLPLRVLVQEDGTPKAGVTVTWTVSAGTVKPASGLTDASGVAATSWTLGSTPGSMSATATVSGAKGSPVTFNAAALTRPGMVASVESGNMQTGEVGTPLPLPLKVRVRTFGTTNAGATVVWQAANGQVTPSSSVTDAEGYATTSWTLGTVAGDSQTVVAQISGAEGSPLKFTARAVAGPAANISGGSLADTVWAIAGYAASLSLPPRRVLVTDRYGNGVAGRPITWSVLSGPVHIESADGLTSPGGAAFARVALDSSTGTAILQATLAGTSATTSFIFTIVQPEHVVVWVNRALTSGANGSSPAVDTIAVGTTMTWLYLDGDPYEGPEISSDGTPSFSPPPLDLYHGKASFTFTTPGTYNYFGMYSGDPYEDYVSGTLVVQ